MRAIAAAPRRERDVLHVHREVIDPHLGSTYHPAMDVAVRTIHRVIIGDVL
jgi:hypothetical protein